MVNRYFWNVVHHVNKYKIIVIFAIYYGKPKTTEVFQDASERSWRNFSTGYKRSVWESFHYSYTGKDVSRSKYSQSVSEFDDG